MDRKKKQVPTLRFASLNDLSSRPERTRISCHAAPDKVACARFYKETRMQCINATMFHRKFGVA